MHSIDQAIEDMERLCFQLNEKQRSHDEETSRRHAIASIARKIDQPFVMQTDSGCRHYHGEYDLQHVNPKRRHASARHGFLFTDIFLLTKHRRRSDRTRWKLLSHCKVHALTTPHVRLCISRPSVFLIFWSSVLVRVCFFLRLNRLTPKRTSWNKLTVVKQCWNLPKWHWNDWWKGRKENGCS